MLESKHVFPPGEEERPSAKMRAKCVGPCEVVELVGLYWHFVDIVWIVIFTAVYLVEYI